MIIIRWTNYTEWRDRIRERSQAKETCGASNKKNDSITPSIFVGRPSPNTFHSQHHDSFFHVHTVEFGRHDLPTRRFLPAQGNKNNKHPISLTSQSILSSA
jgi:hypothetical protein